MKISKVSFVLILMFSFWGFSSVFSQDIYVYKVIGKSKSEVVKTYGKPIHTDESNPEMICMFYKKNKDTMIFVSDNISVYQADALKLYQSEEEAMGEMRNVLNTVVLQNYAPDTLSSKSYMLRKPGVEFNISVNKSSNDSKYEIKVHAVRKE